MKLKDQAAMRNGVYQKGSSFQIRGVSDLVVFLENGTSIWMEVKTTIGTQSRPQKAFEQRIKELGHKYVLVRSREEAIQSVEKMTKEA